MVKYPLPCGCAGPKYISMCELHQQLEREAHARKLGLTAFAHLKEPPHCPTCACAALEHRGALGDRLRSKER